MNSIHELYLRNTRHKSDINELLPILLGLATACEHIVEIGFRTGVSTSAFLAAGAGVTSYDIQKCEPHVSNFKKLADKKFAFIQADSLKIDIPLCDMLFIDSYHSGKQLAGELKRHSSYAKKLIVMHDTETYGLKGQDKNPGLLHAIKAFCNSNEEWRLKLRLRHNNGLVVLERM